MPQQLRLHAFNKQEGVLRLTSNSDCLQSVPVSQVEPQQLGLGYQVMQGQLQLAQRDAHARYNRERMGKGFTQGHPKGASVPVKACSITCSTCLTAGLEHASTCQLQS